MKRALSLLFVITIAGSVGFAQSLNFRNISLQEAINVSATENKPVLFMAYQGTCGHCEKMLNEVFIDTALINFYNKNYIFIKEDLLDKEKAKLYVNRFHITSFPTFVVLNSRSEVLYQFVGEFKTAEFIKQGTLALIPENQIPYVRSAFENNPTDSTASYNYLLVLSRGRLATQPIANTYFNAKNKNLEFTPANWKIVSMSVSDMQSEIFKYMSEHRNDFGAVVTQKKVEKKLYLTAAYNLQTLSSANDTTKYEKIKKIANELNLFTVDSLVFVSDLNIYEKNKNWSSYINTAINGAEKFVWNDANLLRRLSDYIYQYSENRSQLEKAANFAVRSAELKPDYFSNLSAAKVYLKMGDKKEAKKYAEKAVELGKSKNLNTLEAEEIITSAR